MRTEGSNEIKNAGRTRGQVWRVGNEKGELLDVTKPHTQKKHIVVVDAGPGGLTAAGLPTIYESGRSAANLISRRCGVEFISKNMEV